MDLLSEVAPAFVEMAHRIVWASAATVDREGRPHTRILHPLWKWDGQKLVGWIATGPTPVKRAHLERTPHMSLSYWTLSHDTCVADCSIRFTASCSSRALQVAGWWSWRRQRSGPSAYVRGVVVG